MRTRQVFRNCPQPSPVRNAAYLSRKTIPWCGRFFRGGCNSGITNVIAVDNGTAAWKVLQQKQPPDLLILDWMLPEIDGLELCRRIRADQQSAHRYILLITAKDARQDLVSGFEAAADDYLTKPFDRDELRARLRVGERILNLQGDLIRARDALHFQATHDVLTGLCNRGRVLDVFARDYWKDPGALECH